MESLYVRRRSIDTKKYAKREARENDAQILINRPTRIYDGSRLVAVFEKPFTSPDIPQKILNSLKSISYATNTRTGGLSTNSRIFGYAPRNARRRKNFCGPARLNEDNPKFYKTVIHTLANYSAQFYGLYFPQEYLKHRQMSQKVQRRYRIGGGIFTSGIINHNNILKYHHDNGNFKNVLSAMWVFRDGELTGGHQGWQEDKVKFKFFNGSLIFFDGQKIIHGVTPMDGKGNRFSIVFYSLAAMWHCRTLDEELENARRTELRHAKR